MGRLQLDAAQQALHCSAQPGAFLLGISILSFLHTPPQSLLSELGVPPTTYPSAKPQRAIYCSRTLNLRSIVAIGYDVSGACLQGIASVLPRCSVWAQRSR